MLNAYKGLIRGSLDKYDYSNGATYWDGDDYNKRVRYTQGTVFTKDSHNIWNLPNNAHDAKEKGVKNRTVKELKEDYNQK